MINILVYSLVLSPILADPLWLPFQKNPKLSFHSYESLAKNSTTFIVGGTDAIRGANPHQCSLRKTYSGHNCGASIISDQWLITAAHCIDGEEPSSITIRCATLLYDEPGIDYSVVELVVHPLFSGWILDYDIGLIRINGKMILGSQDMDKIELPEQNEQIPVGVNVTVTGWGSILEDGPLSPRLQTLDVPVMANDICLHKYIDVNPVTDRMFCGGYDEGGRDACQGDSGGPVVYNKKLLGAVSWGNGCARPNYPGVYTKVSYFRNWIKLITYV